MEWSGRARRVMLGRGRVSKEHRHVQQVNRDHCHDGHRYRQEFVPRRRLDQRGAIVLRQKWSRGQIEARLANVPPCLIGMEACVGAHHLSRKLQAHGHDARLMPAKYVRAYSKGQKNDFRDAEAIAEAVQRPTMKFVATKTADQLDLQALHRVRERLVRR
jgi:transposase